MGISFPKRLRRVTVYTASVAYFRNNTMADLPRSSFRHRTCSASFPMNFSVDVNTHYHNISFEGVGEPCSYRDDSYEARNSCGASKHETDASYEDANNNSTSYSSFISDSQESTQSSHYHDNFMNTSDFDTSPLLCGQSALSAPQKVSSIHKLHCDMEHLASLNFSRCPGGWDDHRVNNARSAEYGTSRVGPRKSKNLKRSTSFGHFRDLTQDFTDINGQEDDGRGFFNKMTDIDIEDDGFDNISNGLCPNSSRSMLSAHKIRDKLLIPQSLRGFNSENEQKPHRNSISASFSLSECSNECENQDFETPILDSLANNCALAEPFPANNIVYTNYSSSYCSPKSRASFDNMGTDNYVLASPENLYEPKNHYVDEVDVSSVDPSSFSVEPFIDNGFRLENKSRRRNSISTPRESRLSVPTKVGETNDVHKYTLGRRRNSKAPVNRKSGAYYAHNENIEGGVLTGNDPRSRVIDTASSSKVDIIKCSPLFAQLQPSQKKKIQSILMKMEFPSKQSQKTMSDMDTSSDRGSVNEFMSSSPADAPLGSPVLNDASGEMVIDACSLTRGVRQMPPRASLNHNFGPQNFQNCLNTTDKLSGKFKLNACPSLSSGTEKSFPANKLSRRMTSSGLVRPVIKKIANLGTNRFMGKPNSEANPLHAGASDNRFKVFHIDPLPSDCFIEKTNFASKKRVPSDSMKSSNTVETLSAVAERGGNCYPHDVGNVTCDPANGLNVPVVRPPRRKKTVKKITHQSDQLAIQNTAQAIYPGCPVPLEEFCSEEPNEILVPTNTPEKSVVRDSNHCNKVTKRLVQKVKHRIKNHAREDFPVGDTKVFKAQAEDSEHGVIHITIVPTAEGKFGFNVKGGADQLAPVLVSKVAQGSPADLCCPRLNEGDQVLLINGRVVTSMTHDQVVNSIKASKECHSGSLVLTVKQNVYEGDGCDEPSILFVPVDNEGSKDTTPSSPVTSPQELSASVAALRQRLASGALARDFEALHRKAPGLGMAVARQPCNEARNRYRDISPYDATRVVLCGPGGETGSPSSPCSAASFNDYVNASHVVMKVAGSGLTNRYIASQGPLQSTSVHFWQMVWQQHTALVVMLTTCVEQGRSKCHQYWPDVGSTQTHGGLTVTCEAEALKDGYALRRLTLTDGTSRRAVTQLQYLAWPDHGVPDCSDHFLAFVTEVRGLRRGVSQPTVVHCSAGIGRTGVLILMETAQCLIEANQPLYPLDLVQTMRDQRAMMVQTTCQFRFVCEAIERVYAQGLVAPLQPCLR